MMGDELVNRPATNALLGACLAAILFLNAVLRYATFGGVVPGAS